ncbi:zf-HC2 domain-containing protein [bacterium]|nr:zf-HC2 domain-containing protein [bacterium]
MKMTCRIGRYLTAYADNELSERLTRKVERHLASCEDCARELDSIRGFDRILREAPAAPAVTDEQWARFDRILSQELDRVERKASRPVRIREARPVHADPRRRALAAAGVCAMAVLAFVVIGPLGIIGGFTGSGGGNSCIVESLETPSVGYTPMAFTSNDPEMTIIWVFAEEVDGSIRGDGPGAM